MEVFGQLDAAKLVRAAASEGKENISAGRC